MGRVRVVAVALAAAVAVALAWMALRPSETAAVSFETKPVTRGPVTARVTATGTLSPLVQVLVGSQVSGRIQSLLVDFNSPVTQGQVIAQIDPRVFEAQVAEAKANRSAAEAAVKRAEADRTDARLKLQRAAGLAERGVGSQADADTAQAAAQAAEAQVASARASLAQASAALEQAETQLAYTTIVSPIDGVVISRDVDVGQTVAASLQAPTLFTIAGDLRKMEVHTSVAEADVGRIEAGMAVEFGVDAYPSERFPGVVKEIRFAPQTVQNVVTYDAVVQVDNPDRKLRPGMTADVSFLVDERPDALLVPSAALRFVPPPELLASAPPLPSGPEGAGGIRRLVWVLEGSGPPRPVPVRTGVTDGRSTEILEGELAPGDLVVVGVQGEDGSGPGGRRPSFGRFL
jgi:HlyD family secretion protein